MIEFSAAVLEKAKKLSDELVKQDEKYPLIWWVTGSGLNMYRVQIGMEGRVIHYATCTCPHGLNASGESSCYHVAAVLMRLREQ
jgi:uncharacterized Zn finger protein